MMPSGFKISPQKKEMIEMAFKKAGKTKSAFIAETIDEKSGIVKDREQTIRRLAGWLTQEEAQKLRMSVDVLNSI